MDLKKHLPWILALAVLAIFVQWQFLNADIVPLADYLAVDHINYEYILSSFLEYKEFPHWANFHMAGQPYFAHPQNTIFYPATILRLLLAFLSTGQFLSFFTWLTTFLGGLFMYSLMYYLTKDTKISFFSGIVFMAAGNLPSFARGWFYRANTILWTPLIALYLLKAFKEKKWLKNSIFAGLFLSLAFHAAGLSIFLFLVTIFIAFSITYILGKNSRKRLTKLILINLVILLVLLGFSAIKIFPLLEFNSVSSKQRDFSFQESVGKHLAIDKPSDLFDLVKYPIVYNYNKLDPVRTGPVAIILALFSIPLWRKKSFIFFALIAVIALLIVTGSPFYHLYYKFIPGFSKIHHVERSMFLFTFGIAALAGFGLSLLLKKIKEKFKLKNTYLSFIYYFIVVLLVVDLVVLAPKDGHHFADFDKQVNSNDIWQSFENDDSLFRVHNINTRMIGGRASNYASILDQEILYGQTTVWISEYFNEYLGIANQQPAKFYGMLNTKYVYSKDPVEVPGLEFIKEFDRCTDCEVYLLGEKVNECLACTQDGAADQGIDGPFLYENQLFLPRAYSADNSILVIGNNEQSKQIMYALMLQNFDPSNGVIVMTEGLINDADPDFLKRFDFIFLTPGSVDQNSESTLQQYVNSGGTLLPNVLQGESGFDQATINTILDSFQGNYDAIKEAAITHYSPNKRIIDVEPGFLVLSEKFFMFEGWKAKLNGKEKEILRSNGINSAIYIEEPGQLILEYKPKSFRNGLIITSLTIILIIAFFIFDYRKKSKNRTSSLS